MHDLMAGTERAAEAFVRDAATRTTHLRAPLTGEPMLIAFNRGAVDVFADRSEVTAERGLSVAEIIARHQAVQRDSRRVRTNRPRPMSSIPSQSPIGHYVVSENRYSLREGLSGGTSFLVNVSRWEGRRPSRCSTEKVCHYAPVRFDEGFIAWRSRRSPPSDTRLSTAHGCVALPRDPWIYRNTFARIGSRPADCLARSLIERGDPAIPPPVGRWTAVHL